MKQNDILVTKIENLMFGFGGIARQDNLTVIVEGKVIPEDIVKLKIKKIKKKYILASLEEVIKFSHLREESLCLHNRLCGSCSWLDINYKKQLLLKKEMAPELNNYQPTQKRDLISILFDLF